MNTALKPFVKWAGGKRQLLPEIRGLLPADIAERVYYEPFVGAGAVFFNLVPRRAIINDLNSELMLTYRVIRDHVEELIGHLKHHRERHCREYYYEVRARAAGLWDTPEKAARFVYLNKTCYNGLYRVNSQGLFNVPLGRQKDPLICEEALLRDLCAYLGSPGISILNTDFEEAISRADSNSFVYFDPPYHGGAKTSFKNYQAGGFGDTEQVRLRDLFLSLKTQGIPSLLSNSDTPFIRDLYGGRDFRIAAVSARRAINSSGGGRGRVGEVLIANYSC